MTQSMTRKHARSSFIVSLCIFMGAMSIDSGTTDLQRLHALTRDFVNAIIASARKMPYSLRFLAHEVLKQLQTRFPNQPEEAYAVPLARLLFYRCINPAIMLVFVSSRRPCTITDTSPEHQRHLI